MIAIIIYTDENITKREVCHNWRTSLSINLITMTRCWTIRTIHPQVTESTSFWNTRHRKLFLKMFYTCEVWIVSNHFEHLEDLSCMDLILMWIYHTYVNQHSPIGLFINKTPMSDLLYSVTAAFSITKCRISLCLMSSFIHKTLQSVSVKLLLD